MSKLITRNNLGKVTKVIYHSPCCDGFGGAYVFWRLLGTTNAQNQPIEYIPASHTTSKDVIKEKIQEFKDEYVVYVDYCDQKDIMTEVHSLVKGLLILDHHKTTPQELTEQLQECAVIDMNRSGAILAWDYCYPERAGDAPNFLTYIGDRDIWKWEFPETEPFTTSFYTEVPFEFEEYQKYEDWQWVQAAIDKGKAALSYENNQIQAAAQSAVIVSFLGYNVAVTNSTVHASKLGNTLAVLEGVDFAFIWFYDHKNNGIKVSLRSTKEKVDVSEIAQRFGGGGHRCASGFFWKNDSIQTLLGTQ